MDYVQPYFSTLQATLDSMASAPIDQAIQILHQARVNGGKIFIMGNGGSASTATHFVCDLAKNTRQPGWPDYRVVGLADNIALMSAYANDEGFENVFAQQLACLVAPGDVVIGISTSGNSANVLRAVDVARANDAFTIGFTGFDAGLLGDQVDLHIHVPSDCIEQVEDVHLILEHLITKALREMTQQPQ